MEDINLGVEATGDDGVKRAWRVESSLHGLQWNRMEDEEGSEREVSREMTEAVEQGLRTMENEYEFERLD